MTERLRLEKVVSRVGDLPAIPAIVTEVIDLTSDPDASVSSVSRLIERDPVLTAKLLKLSNSAYFGMRQVVGTLKLALVILGVREVRNMVLGIAAIDTLRDEDTEILLGQEGLWRHSLLVAGIAKKLGAHLGLSHQGEDFIAGLMHDIGKLVLWKYLGQEYKEIYERAKREGIPLHQLEEDALGFNHADVVAALAEAWNLPETLIFALGAHHLDKGRIPADGPAPKLAALVRIANAAAWDDFEAEDVGELASCTDEAAWKALATDEGPLDRESRRAILREIKDEISQTPTLIL
ncbi:MAG: HDOD domain-containing protein [Candidatus Hydrogenedentes bacterium]|nr:HDOD domain-containing protein [Candidatus Hydrogenedentota bacterium]